MPQMAPILWLPILMTVSLLLLWIEALIFFTSPSPVTPPLSPPSSPPHFPWMW